MHHGLDLYEKIAIQYRGRISTDVYLYRSIYNNTKISIMFMLGSEISLQQVLALLAKGLKTEGSVKGCYQATALSADSTSP